MGEAARGDRQARFNPRSARACSPARCVRERGRRRRRPHHVVTVPGALEAPLALQRLAQSGNFDALVALGAVIRGDTYHFEIVANESAAGIASVQLEFGIPIGNGVLTLRHRRAGGSADGCEGLRGGAGGTRACQPARRDR